MEPFPRVGVSRLEPAQAPGLDVSGLTPTGRLDATEPEGRLKSLGDALIAAVPDSLFTGLGAMGWWESASMNSAHQCLLMWYTDTFP